MKEEAKKNGEDVEEEVEDFEDEESEEEGNSCNRSESIRTRDGNPSNFLTGFGFLQESVKKSADSRF